MKQPTDEQQIRETIGNQWWRLNNLYYVIDAYGRRVKFVPNQVQKYMYDHPHVMELVLKSRQHGVTTWKCIETLDAALFTPNLRCGIIAHNQADAQNFFTDKVKYAYDNLPEWLRKTFKAKEDSALKLSFSNNSSIRVGTSLRSGTLQRLHVSEFGKICAKYPKKAQEIVTGSFNTVHVGQRISVESTAEGRSGKFYEYCQKAMASNKRNMALTEMDFKFFFFAWFIDPKNSLPSDGVTISASLREYFKTLEDKHGIVLSPDQKAWYSKKQDLMENPDDMKREYPSTPNEAFAASIQGVYYEKQMSKSRLDGRIGNVPMIEGYPVDTWWDLGMNDTTVILFTQTIGREVRFFDAYQNSGEGLAHYAKVMRERKYSYGVHYAPHDISVRELGTGKTRQQTARGYGIIFRAVRKLSIHDGIEACRSIFPFCYFDEEKCDFLIEALDHYRKQWDEQTATYKDQPLHDKHSNPADAFRTFAVGHRFTPTPGQSGRGLPVQARDDWDRLSLS